MRSRLLAAAIAAALPSFLAAQASSAPCFEPNFGTQLGTGDDVVFSSVPLGFTFNYNSVAYTDIEVSTNGFVWLGANSNTDPRCCSGTGAQFVLDAASIAILWTDLITSAASSAVYFNALPGRAVITWKDISEFGAGTSTFTLQMQITAANEVTFWYSPTTSVSQTFHSAVCGITPGNGAIDPGSTDLSAALPLISGTQPTVYEEWAGATFDMAQRTFEFIPNGSGGWLGLDRPGCAFQASSWTPYGTGCPPLTGSPNAEFYELFGTGPTFDLSNTAIDLIPAGSGYLVLPSSATFYNGFTAANNLGDDQTLPVSLPFTLTTPAGSVTSVGMCSNGFLALDNSLNSPYFAAPTGFTGDGPRIYGLWTDLYRPGAGQTFADQVSPTQVAFTWNGVAEFFNTTPAVTFQIQVNASGIISILWQSVNIASHPILVGFSRGNGVQDPGNTDISVAMPFQTAGGQQPLILSASTNPVLGSSFPLTMTQQPTGVIAAFMILGFTQQAIPLAGLGMPGCTQYVSLDSSLFTLATPGATTVTLNLPNAPNLAGYTIFAQGAEFAPGVNPFGVAASNGGQITLGFF